MKRLLYILILINSTYTYAQKHERWGVKTLSDGFEPNLHSMQIFSSQQIQDIPLTIVKDTTPRLPIEQHVVSIVGQLKRIRKEEDGDVHLEIQLSGTDSTMICEAIQADETFTAPTPYIGMFKSVRRTFDSLTLGSVIAVTGLLFQDKAHNPSVMRLRNFIEIHPILEIDIIKGKRKKRIHRS